MVEEALVVMSGVIMGAVMSVYVLDISWFSAIERGIFMGLGVVAYGVALVRKGYWSHRGRECDHHG